MPNALKDELPRYLRILSEINKSYRTYDIDFHPVDVVTNLLDYTEIQRQKGLFSLDGGNFVPPSLTSVPEEDTAEKVATFVKERPHTIPFINRRTYRHTGPKVFLGYFNFLGIDKGVILPVPPQADLSSPKCH